MNVSFVSLRSTRVHLQNNTFVLRKEVESHCDMAFQKYYKIGVSKEVCLHYVTLPFKVSAVKQKIQTKSLCSSLINARGRNFFYNVVLVIVIIIMMMIMIKKTTVKNPELFLSIYDDNDYPGYQSHMTIILKLSN